jgi:hypothetical protein
MALAILTAGAGCAAAPSTPSGSDSAPPPAVASPLPSQVDIAPASTSAPAPAGLLVEMRAASHPGFERLVFEFGGEKPPPYRIQAVDEVRQDPTDKLISLRGKRFFVVVFDGGTLDTAPRESDPAKARRYTGPERITPDLPLLREVAIAGDFEAVLSFGVGLSGPARTDVQVLSSPARLVIDFRGQ